MPSATANTLLAQWPSDFLGVKKWLDASATQAFEAGKSYHFRIAGNLDMAPGGFSHPAVWA